MQTKGFSSTLRNTKARGGRPKHHGSAAHAKRESEEVREGNNKLECRGGKEKERLPKRGLTSTLQTGSESQKKATDQKKELQTVQISASTKNKKCLELPSKWQKAAAWTLKIKS